MKTPENNKWLDEVLSDAISSTETSADFEQWKQQHPQAVEMLTARAKLERSTVQCPHISRIKIMKSLITKLAVAAAVITVVLLGLSEFISTGGASGVVWTDVARKVEASRGVVYRRTTTRSDRPGKEDYQMIYSCPTHSRTDHYKDDQINSSLYCDYDAMTLVSVQYEHKVYFEHQLGEQALREHQTEVAPNAWLEKFLSCEYRKLGQKMIDGVLCEGIETTDPALDESSSPVESVLAQLWVSVETGYPVRCEGNVVFEGDNGVRIEAVLDQFQWDVELDASEFEPKIPPDYEQM